MTRSPMKEDRFEKFLRDAPALVRGARVLLVPLRRRDFARLLWNRSSLEARFGAGRKIDAPPAPIRRALKWLYDQGPAAPSVPLLWRTPWLALLPRERACAGFFCFKGAPKDGEAEIAYFIAPSFRNRGIATCGVIAMTRRAFAEGASSVLAETELDARASQRVLQKAGFERCAEPPYPEEDSIFWRLQDLPYYLIKE